MANTIQISLEVKDDGSATIRQVSGEFKKMKDEATRAVGETRPLLEQFKQHWLAITAAAYGAERALSQVWAMTKRGAEFEEAQGRLNRQLAAFGTTADAVVPKIQRLVSGQLSLEEATRLTSRALASGLLTPDQVGLFVQLAEILGDLKGQGIEESFQELQRALLGGRSEALKSLGIYVDLDKEIETVASATRRHSADIDENEKALIRRNAMLRESAAVLAQHATAMASDADKLTAMAAAYDTMTLKISQGVKAIAMTSVERAPGIGGFSGGFSAATALDRLLSTRTTTFTQGPRQARDETQTKLEQEQARAVALAREHASAVDGVTAAMAAYSQAIAMGKDRLAAINDETRRQQQLQQSVRAQLAAEREDAFARRLKDLSPEDQLQKLRQRLNDISEKDSPKTVEALERIRLQVDALGKTEGAERLRAVITDQIVTAMERLDRQSQATQQQLAKDAEAAAGKLQGLASAAGDLRQRFEDEFQLKFSGDQELLGALQKIQAEARQTAQALAALRIGGGGTPASTPGGTGGGVPLDLPAGDMNFAVGTTRVPRTGLARLHYGEAVLPQDRNFLDPAIGGFEREARLARLATGQIPSFQSGTSSFVPPGGRFTNILSFMSDLPLLQSGGRLLLSGLPRDPQRRVEQLEDKLQELEDSWNLFVWRTTGENRPRGSMSLDIANAEWMLSHNALTGVRAQLWQMLAETRARAGQPGGGGGGIVIPVTLNVDGRTLLREVILPKMREIGLS